MYIIYGQPKMTEYYKETSMLDQSESLTLVENDPGHCLKHKHISQTWIFLFIYRVSHILTVGW